MGEKGRMVYNRENAIFSDFGQKWAEYGEEGGKLVKKGLEFGQKRARYNRNEYNLTIR
tara:strand:- start:720 stop:893 length:174 start_codon:yes stop_codon:yes gene_type:complete